MKHRLWRYLIAIVVGNGIYFAVEQYLPPRGHHQPYHLDWGLAVDFWICLACYGIVRLIR
jgi:hypothetical protein